tara:strand:+ start:2115 stop:2513 length:399 start_codon:yes stop_codon:yes gene_type:complete
MKKISHIGIAVSNIEESNNLFSKILGVNYTTEFVDSEGVITSFFKIGDSNLELVASNSEESAIAKYLTKNKEGVHHIAFDVDDIKSEIQRLKKEGVRVLNEVPKIGAGKKLICFLHPKDTNGVLIELCQKID